MDGTFVYGAAVVDADFNLSYLEDIFPFKTKLFTVIFWTVN